MCFSPVVGYTRVTIASIALVIVVVLEAIAIANRATEWDKVLDKLKEVRSKELEYQNNVLDVSSTQVCYASRCLRNMVFLACCCFT